MTVNYWSCLLVIRDQEEMFFCTAQSGRGVSLVYVVYLLRQRNNTQQGHFMCL